MASGSERIKITDYNYLLFSWNQTTMDAKNQQSVVNIKVELVADEYGGITSDASKRFQLYLNGRQEAFEFPTIGIASNSRKTLYQNAFTFVHNPDGTYSFSWSVKLNVDIDWGTDHIGEIIGSGQVTLDPVVLAATITGITDFTDENNPTMVYSNPSGTRLKGLRAKVRYKKFISEGFYLDSDLLEYRDVPKDVDGSYTFPITDAERETIRNAASNSKTLDVVFILESTLTDELVETSEAKRVLSIVNAEPDVTGIINDDAGYAIIRDHDPVTVKCIGTAKKGATIKSYRITNGGQEITSSSGQFANISSDTFHFTVTDSRGFSTTITKTIDIVPYIALTCNVETENSEIDPETNHLTTTFYISGKCYFGSMMDGGSNNALTLIAQARNMNGWASSHQHTFGNSERISEYDGTNAEHYLHTEFSTLTIDTQTNTYSATVKATIYYTGQAMLYLRAQDSLKELYFEPKGSKAIPIFDWSADDFSFNVPVTINGKEVPTIIDSGTFSFYPYESNMFYWRKWSDGTSECEGKITLSDVVVNKAWGSMYTSGAIAKTNVSLPSGLFIKTPDIVAQLLVRDVGGILMVPGGAGSMKASKSQTGAYEILRGNPVEGLGNHYTVCYNIKGRWK